MAAPHLSVPAPRWARRARAVLSGARARGTRVARFTLRSAFRPGLPRRALYAALSIPLAAVYASIFAGLAGSVVLSVQGIGVVLFLALLALVRSLGGLERRLAARLLGLHITPYARLRHERGALRRVRMLAFASSTWRTLAWLGARVLLGLAVLATLTFAVVTAGALILEAPWNSWTAGPFLALIALIGLLTVVALDVQLRIVTSVAPRLLDVATEEKLAALRQASQRLADRNRVARDLHDTIGHALTASLLQATAARRTLQADGEPGARSEAAAFTRQALEHIETNTRTALDELDRALSVLRDEATGSPQPERSGEAPGLGEVEGLLAGLRDGGLPVTLVMDGHLDDVPPGLGQLGYRVVQEGTTNVLRHAGCPATTVAVVRRGAILLVSVRNGAPTQRRRRPGPGGGRGLDGLRDRTAAAGGDLLAAPTPEGGYELRATLPIPASA